MIETASNILVVIFVLAGAFYMLVGSIGINRLPDVYCRAHASGKVDTLGIMLFILGLVFYEGLTIISLKLLLVAVFVAMTSPVASHALGRRALLHGVKPWKSESEAEEQ